MRPGCSRPRSQTLKPHFPRTSTPSPHTLDGLAMNRPHPDRRATVVLLSCCRRDLSGCVLRRARAPEQSKPSVVLRLCFHLHPYLAPGRSFPKRGRPPHPEPGELRCPAAGRLDSVRRIPPYTPPRPIPQTSLEIRQRDALYWEYRAGSVPARGHMKTPV